MYSSKATFLEFRFVFGSNYIQFTTVNNKGALWNLSVVKVMVSLSKLTPFLNLRELLLVLVSAAERGTERRH